MFQHLVGFPDLPPIWMLGFAILSGLLGVNFPVIPFGSLFVNGLGIMLLVIGTSLILWSALWFYRKKTRIEPKQKPSALIVEGPYQISRNPIYLGMAIIILGVAVWSGGISALLPALAFPPLITNRFIFGEEALLRSAFGQEADYYLAATGRWIWFLR